MGLFDIFKKSKPFYKLKDRDEIYKWFKESDKWNKLDDKVIKILIDKFITNLNAFEVFVCISETAKLIENNYLPLCEDESLDTEYVCSTFGLTLYNTGSIYRDEFLEMFSKNTDDTKTLSKLIDHAFMGYESAVIIDKFCFGSYYQMAFLKGKIFENQKDGIEYCKQGLDVISELENIPKSELGHFSKASLENANQSKDLLNSLIQELKA